MDFQTLVSRCSEREMKMRRKLFILFCLLTLPAWLAADENDTAAIRQFAEVADATAIENVQPVKNIILMIGDGMGFEAVTAARIAALGRGIGLAFDRMPVIGQSVTYSLNDDLITDSAAGATALASGLKTLNGRIGEDREGRKTKTILELAKELGKSAGIVVTCEATHATPACFASHVKERNNYWEIARQMSQAPLDVLLGGGYGYFLAGSRKESFRDDELDLLGEMQKRGAVVTTKIPEFRGLDLSRVDKLVGLFAPSHLPPAGKREISLPEMTQAALKILSRNPKGFFLMIEGSQIDWAGHANNLQYSVEETLDFDQCLQTVLDFAGKDGKTLVIVTADHETGGLSLNSADEGKKTLTAGWTQGDHTANVVPLLAFGPNAAAFGRVVQNHQIPQLAVQGWGVKNFTGFAFEK
ncbi:MAG: hypothetical protein A3F83_16980 [Candidatus Glassbacteria bacterium RIFCSPLOWO2_12_FULL_58_11]|uniref:Alkaline phosphatase n=1 Tax=Candidatus Glassbacteria bacterium RIFCSPLOWO2_12_FULL_58_11 TaxID=1817867 RepID=A0A1F5YLJ1_9BACT|nr:MAG: hypothetical protein A3F83_16980 [Candidatus Glassbacteria bacterium RIFCSPLOWO2_12_FULL_58_11]